MNYKVNKVSTGICWQISSVHETAGGKKADSKSSVYGVFFVAKSCASLSCKIRNNFKENPLTLSVTKTKNLIKIYRNMLVNILVIDDLK